jgi:hypothetical protein
MTEAMEKSNHHAHKDYQSRTMRGGGHAGNEDPVYLDMQFSFCRLLDLLKRMNAANMLDEQLNKANLLLRGQPISSEIFVSYKEMCRRTPNIPVMQIGVKRPLPLLGMRFLTIGRFGGGKIPLATELETMLRELGAIVLDKAKALRIMRSHKLTPHCYAILKDDKDLKLGTTTPSRDATTSKKKTVINKIALHCGFMARGDFKFLRWDYVTQVHKTGHIEDPEKFILHPGPNVVPLKVNEKRHLLIRQCEETNGNYVSTFTSVKRCRIDNTESIPSAKRCRIDDDLHD